MSHTPRKEPHVIMVDDDADERELFSDLLTYVNPFATLIPVASGSSLFELLDIGPTPDLIFLDLNMPRMTGFECLAQLRQSEETKFTTVVIYTNSNHEKDIDLAFILGATYFLTKSMDTYHVEEALKFVLKKCMQDYFFPTDRKEFVLLPPY